MIPFSGDIRGMAVPWLLHDVRKALKTGTAVFEQQAETIKVFFKQGEIIFASSTGDNSALGKILLDSGKINQKHFEKASAGAEKTGKKIGAVFFEMGVLSPQDLVERTKVLAKRNMLAIFSWQDGKYRFDENALPGTEIVPLPMSTMDLLLEAIRGLEWQQIRASLPPLNAIVQKNADKASLFQRNSLDVPEQTVLRLIDNASSLQDICAHSNLGDLRTLSALYVLLALRIAVVGVLKEQQEKEFVFHEDRTGFAAGVQSPPTAVQETLINRELLQNAYNSLDLQNYYEILGVGHSASPEEIKQAYTGLFRLYHPRLQKEPQFFDMRQQLQTLILTINEAYKILHVKTTRDQYNLDLASGVKRYGNEQKADGDSETASEAAAAKFNEGLRHLRIHNFWGAEESFRAAVRLDAAKAEYGFHLGLALLHLPRRGQEAEEYFLNAIKAAPSRVEYYLELGNYYLKNGDKTKALEMFRAALRRDPHSEKIKQAVKSAGG